MKKTILIMYLCLNSCSSYKGDKFKFNEVSWKDYFKECVFVTCIKECYKNETIFNELTKKDIFYDNDVIYGEINYINKLSKDFVNRIPLPEIPCPECKKDDKYYMANCLRYYKSRELDSIAEIEYKKFKNQQKDFSSN